MSHPTRVVSWMVKTFASGLDALLLSSFEAQRAEYWQTLYSSASMGPFIILCSQDDQLAPHKTLDSFAYRLQELGADVKHIKWSSSHIAHYRHHPVEYRAAVKELLAKASHNFSSRQLTRAADKKIPESVCYLHDAAVSSNESLRRVAVGPSDHFFLPSSVESSEARAGSSLIDEQKKAELFQLTSIKPQGILSQILFDVCVPKNIESWDIKPMPSSNRSHTFASARRHDLSNPIKCIKHSRL